MPLSRLSSDKLVAYLSQLSPDVAVFLIREIELHRLDGLDDPAYDWILQAARQVVRMSDRSIDRITTPVRAFCDPFNDLLVDEMWGVTRPARVSRKSIDPIWHWLREGDDGAPMRALCERLQTEARRGAGARIEAIRREMIDRAADTIEAALAAGEKSDKARRRLEMVIGGREVLDDAVQIAMAIRAFDAIRELRQRLPQSIDSLTDELRHRVMDALARFRAAAPGRDDIGYATVLARLDAPAQALRLAVCDLGTDDSEAVGASAYAPLCRLLFGDTDLAARNVDHIVREGAGTAAIFYALALYHRHAEGIDGEIELDGRGQWAGALAASRRIASQALDAEVRRVPELIAAVFKPHLGRMAGHPGPVPDQPAIEQAGRALTLSVGCRPFLHQLSLNEAVMKCEKEVQARLDAISAKLLDELRKSDGAELARVEEWLGVLAAMVRIARGEREAGLLSRAARVARHARDDEGSTTRAAG